MAKVPQEKKDYVVTLEGLETFKEKMTSPFKLELDTDGGVKLIYTETEANN